MLSSHANDQRTGYHTPLVLTLVSIAALAFAGGYISGAVNATSSDGGVTVGDCLSVAAEPVACPGTWRVTDIADDIDGCALAGSYETVRTDGHELCLTPEWIYRGGAN